MPRKQLSPVGIKPLNPKNWKIPEDDKALILAALPSHIGVDERDIFIQDITYAMLTAKRRQEMTQAPEVKAAAVKTALSKAVTKASETVDSLKAIPPAAQRLYASYRESLHMAQEVLTSAENALLLAREALSGRGDDKDYAPAILVHDIAEALTKIEVTPTYQRPTTGEGASPLWTISAICLELCWRKRYRLAKDEKDILPILKESQNIRTNEC